MVHDGAQTHDADVDVVRRVAEVRARPRRLHARPAPPGGGTRLRRLARRHAAVPRRVGGAAWRHVLLDLLVQHVLPEQTGEKTRTDGGKFTCLSRKHAVIIEGSLSLGFDDSAKS